MNQPPYRTKQLTLLYSLCQQVEALGWHETPKRDGFHCAVGPYDIVLTDSETESEGLRLTLLDLVGDTKDTFLVRDLAHLEPGVEEKARTLFQAARRKALDMEVVLDDLIQMLAPPYRSMAV